MTRPKKPLDTKNALRVSSGGGWDRYVPSWVRAASRDANGPARRSDSIGFRAYLPGRQPR